MSDKPGRLGVAAAARRLQAAERQRRERRQQFLEAGGGRQSAAPGGRWRRAPEEWESYRGEEAYVTADAVWVTRLALPEEYPDGTAVRAVVHESVGLPEQVFGLYPASDTKLDPSKNPIKENSDIARPKIASIVSEETRTGASSPSGKHGLAAGRPRRHD